MFMINLVKFYFFPAVSRNTNQIGAFLYQGKFFPPKFEMSVQAPTFGIVHFLLSDLNHQ